uniref:Uncharacterized protein n=1 Tax=viral metagenome TaxID=1070528 RepID=A0A6C0BNY9_9ZZZZ
MSTEYLRRNPQPWTFSYVASTKAVEPAKLVEPAKPVEPKSPVYKLFVNTNPLVEALHEALTPSAPPEPYKLFTSTNPLVDNLKQCVSKSRTKRWTKRRGKRSTKRAKKTQKKQVKPQRRRRPRMGFKTSKGASEHANWRSRK